MNAGHAKLLIAIAIDLLDFVIGRILGFGTIFDAVVALIAVLMFGWKGLFALWEVADVSDQIDGFVPTLTLIALADLRKRKAAEPEA